MFQQSLTFSAIVAQLRKLCQEKQTGTLYFLENGHLLGQASLRDGEIISLMAKKKHGTDALSCLLDLSLIHISWWGPRCWASSVL